MSRRLEPKSCPRRGRRGPGAPGWAALAAVASLVGAAPAGAQQQRSARMERVALDTRHPLGTAAEQTRRLGREAEQSEYRLEDEQLRVFLPKGLAKKRRRGRPFGLLVWLTPGKRALVPRSWERVLERRRLVLAGADEAGVDRPLAVRIGLALDCVATLLPRLELAPERVYVCGFSDGGNLTATLALHWPDVFRGAVYLAGCDWFRDVPVQEKPGAFWNGTVPRPSEDRLTLTRQRPHVWLSGTEDETGALPQARDVFKLASEEDGFLRTRLIEVPKLTHDYPPSGRLEEALEFLDDPAPAAEGREQDGGE